MNVVSSNQIFRPIIRRPSHDPNIHKAPHQQEIERERNVLNNPTRNIAKDSVQRTYDALEKMVANTDYQVSYGLDGKTGTKSFSIIMANSGRKVAEFPPKAALEIAERSRYESRGLLLDKNF